MTRDETEQLADLFRLLGEPNRLKLVAACLDGPKSVSELTDAVGVSQSLASQHLRLLRAGRLLKQDRRGRNVFYDLPDCHVRAMLTNMMDHVTEHDHEQEEAEQ